MTAAQLQAMQAGRDRVRALHREQQIQRVTAYQTWIRTHRPLTDMPPVPTDADYRAFRLADR